VLPKYKAQERRPWLAKSKLGGQWHNDRIFMFLLNNRGGWLDHGGFSRIAGIPVLIGEPNSWEPWAKEEAPVLQARFDCPVTYDRAARHARHAVRVAVWFTLAEPVSRCGAREPRPRETFEFNGQQSPPLV
jgi:hypothetical protein